jgi:hypothetical protein
MMKIIVAVLFLTATLCAADDPIPDPRCPAGKPDGGLISHPTDCGKYLRCSWGWGYGRSQN